MDADQYQRQQLRNDPELSDLWQILDEVKDPEIPVLSIWDLGILRAVQQEGNLVTVTITPTYSGCPAMRMIEDQVREVLSAHGYQEVNVETQLSPAWSTEWMSQEGRERLREYGIAPPANEAESEQLNIGCPNCGSSETEVVSEFGSTACKALYKCRSCLEPFDYFKCI